MYEEGVYYEVVVESSIGGFEIEIGLGFRGEVRLWVLFALRNY